MKICLFEGFRAYGNVNVRELLFALMTNFMGNSTVVSLGIAVKFCYSRTLRNSYLSFIAGLRGGKFTVQFTEKMPWLF